MGDPDLTPGREPAGAPTPKRRGFVVFGPGPDGRPARRRAPAGALFRRYPVFLGTLSAGAMLVALVALLLR